MPKLRWFLIPVMILTLVGAVSARENYQTLMFGELEGGYDMNPGEDPPPPTGLDGATDFPYGFYGGFDFYFDLDVDMPAPDEGIFGWFLYPNIEIFGLLFQEEDFFITVDEFGFVIQSGREIIFAKSWSELGVDWIPGLGIFLGIAPTPIGLWPWNPDWLYGERGYDQDGDLITDMEVYIEPDLRDSYQGGALLFRSFSWIGSTGTSIPSDLADWLENTIEGVNADILRDIDLGFMAIVDEALYEWGGPIEGPEALFNAQFNFKLTAQRDETSTMETTWGQVKALY